MLDRWQLAVSEARSQRPSRHTDAEPGASKAVPSRSQTPRSLRISGIHEDSTADSSLVSSRYDRRVSFNAREALGEALSLQHRLGGTEPVREVAELVSRQLGRPISASSISDWLSGKSVPRQIEVVRAMVTEFHQPSRRYDPYVDGVDDIAQLDWKRYVTGEIWRMAYHAAYQISVDSESVTGVHNLAKPLLYRLRRDLEQSLRDSSDAGVDIDRYADYSASPSDWSCRSESDQWGEGLAALREYVARHGHARIPRRYVKNGVELGQWVVEQRRNRDQLSRSRRAQLERIPNWHWGANSNPWNDAYSALEKFVAREGHACVPIDKIEQGISLGRWVSQQRAQRDSMDVERFRRLEHVPGWSWDRHTDKWTESFTSLQIFVEREGHSRVPHSYVQSGFKLGQWVANQRRVGNVMDDKRRASLEALPGWSWNLADDVWNRNFAALQSFVSRTGHTNVPFAHIENEVRLGRWVTNIRSKKAKGLLSDEHCSRLEGIPGWTWSAL